jgi:hypothetical protein
MQLAKLTSTEDLPWFSEPPDGLWTESEDGPVRPAGWMARDAGPVQPWTMYLEVGDSRTDDEGEKDDMIRLAREAGVTDESIVIFDRAARGYKPLA